MHVGPWVLQQLEGVHEDVVVGFAHDRGRVLRITPVPSSHHVGMDVGLPVDGALLPPLHRGPVQLQEAGLHDEHAPVPLLEDLLGGHALQDHPAQHVVVEEQRRQAARLSTPHAPRRRPLRLLGGQRGDGRGLTVRVIQRGVHLLERGLRRCDGLCRGEVRQRHGSLLDVRVLQGEGTLLRGGRVLPPELVGVVGGDVLRVLLVLLQQQVRVVVARVQQLHQRLALAATREL